ncbi:MAG TPA: TIGR03067 domain-containing protein [Gemmataceae bacterium]|nr:TIGR03067 domain-containing protein [Gemmataceae bacterium]
MVRCLIALTSLMTALVAIPQGDDASKKDLDAMQGVWKVVELTESGEKLLEKETEPVEVTILANKMSIHDKGQFREEITLKLDAKAKVKAVDFVYTKGGNTGKTELGIYNLDGDKLTICMNETKGGARPTEFTSTKANGCSVAVLKRVKK